MIDCKLLYTDRLVLRELTPEVMKAVHALENDEQIKTFLGLKNDAELNDAKEKFAKGLSTWAISFSNFQLIDKTNGRLIGACGFHTWHVRHSRAEIGYAIYDEANRNKGYMKEALVAILKYGFDELKLNRIEAGIGPDNTASLKLVRSLGFVEEGHLRQHYFKDNVLHDSIWFSLLKSEFHL